MIIGILGVVTRVLVLDDHMIIVTIIMFDWDLSAYPAGLGLTGARSTLVADTQQTAMVLTFDIYLRCRR